VSVLAAERDRIVSGFPGFAAALEEGTPAWLPPLREAAIERFAELGFPSRKREEWKYTNVTPIARAIAQEPGDGAPTVAETPAFVDTAAMEHALVFVDGRFAPELSSPGALPAGAVVDGLARITVGGRVHEVSSGGMLLMPANVPHAVHAAAPFKMLLVMLRSGD